MARLKKGETRTKEQQQADVLAALEDCGNITNACKKESIPRRTFYNWLEEENFKAAFEQSMKIGTGVLEDEAKRRAVEGVLKPVYYQGLKVGTVREYSDTLLIVLLKAHAPEKYKERVSAEHSGPNGQPIATTNASVVLYIPSNGRDKLNGGQ